MDFRRHSCGWLSDFSIFAQERISPNCYVKFLSKVLSLSLSVWQCLLTRETFDHVLDGNEQRRERRGFIRERITLKGSPMTVQVYGSDTPTSALINRVSDEPIYPLLSTCHGLMTRRLASLLSSVVRAAGLFEAETAMSRIA